jgi:hypothetical protein
MAHKFCKNLGTPSRYVGSVKLARMLLVLHRVGY